MFIAHLPAAYLVLKSAPFKLGATASTAFLIGSIAPDVDMAYFYLIDGRQHHHHDYLTHRPVLWYLVLLLGLCLSLEADDNADTSAIKETKTTQGDVLTYVFEADDLALIPRENNMPPSYSFVPAIMLSTGNWGEYAKVMKDKLKQAASGQKQTEEQARTLVKKVKGSSAKAIVIRDFVVRNIRRAGPGAGSITNDAITDADITLADGYGNSTDNAIVLYAMCKAAKLKPEFVLAGYTARVEPLRQGQLDYSGASLFGAVLVRVKIDGKDVYLNDSNQYDQLGVTGYDDCPVMELAKGRIAELDIDDELENRSYQEYYIAIDTAGDATFQVNNRIQGGSFGARKRMFAEMIPEMRDRYVQQLVASVSQSATLTQPLETRYDSYPGIEQFGVKVDKYAVCDGDSIYFDVPNGLSVLGLQSDEHKSPYYINGPVESEIRIYVDLPEGYSKVLMAPQSKTWQLPDNAGVLSTEVTTDSSGDMVITQKVKLNDAVVDPDNYPELLEINRQVSHKNMEMILVNKAKP